MNIQITDPNWVTSHRDEIISWSSTEILSFVHREIFTNISGGLSTYQAIKSTFGFANADQEIVIDTVLRYREELSEMINEITKEYHLILHRLQIDEVEVVRVNGTKLILRLYNHVHPIAPKIDDIGERLANGEFGLTCDNQKSLLILGSQYNKNLLAIDYCLSVWISAHSEC